MKNNLIKLISLFAIGILTVSAFGQRRGSFGGGSMGGGRPSYSAPSRPSFGGPSFSSPSGPSFGQGQRQAIAPPRSSFGQGVTTAPRSSVPMGTSRPVLSRPSGSITSYRAGYRPPLSVHFYGRPYSWGGRQIYWYGNGYYSLFPGGPLILGNAGMPGYGAAYGYNPYAVAPVVGRPIVVQPNPFGFVWYVLGTLLIFVIIIAIVRSVS